jgi:hypothetical protein
VANKLVATYETMGLNRIVIRMYCWSEEMRSATVGLIEAQKEELYHRIARKKNEEEPKSKDGPLAKYDKENDKSNKMRVRRAALSFLRPNTLGSKSHYRAEKHSRKAPTLDEAVAAYYEEHKDSAYAKLGDMSLVDSADLPELRCMLVDKVYHDFIQKVDVIVTTPVTASKFASSLRAFDPQLVIFDEVPHARELSVMIPIANFYPKAWIFTGDHRQVCDADIRLPSPCSAQFDFHIVFIKFLHRSEPGKILIR